MNDFVLVGIFQVNVTLGILYIGLQQFRFRENLYDDIVQLINQHGYANMHRAGWAWAARTTYKQLVRGEA